MSLLCRLGFHKWAPWIIESGIKTRVCRRKPCLAFESDLA